MKPLRSAPTNLSAAGRITAILFLVSGLWMPTTHAQTGNTKTGDAAMVSITTGDYNTADGLQALNKNTSGSLNTGVGVNALSQNTTATYNTATGFEALFLNSTGTLNTACGAQALHQNNASYNTATGVNTQVAKVNPGLVLRDAEGKISTVRYEAVNAMLLNEFLKEHRKVEQLEAAIADQGKHADATAVKHESEIALLTDTVRQQASQLQKVSAQIQSTRAVAQTIAENQKAP